MLRVSSTTGSFVGVGERISTGFVESTINQLVAKRLVKKQQMRWTPSGAHLVRRPGHLCSDNSTVALVDFWRHGSLGRLRREFEVIHHSAELGERCRFYFPHRVTAMDLHCGFGDAYISGNLLVQAPRRDMSQNDARVR
jgi:hypothetical protein